jgi:hypothetical protein
VLQYAVTLVEEIGTCKSIRDTCRKRALYSSIMIQQKCILGSSSGSYHPHQPIQTSVLLFTHHFDAAGKVNNKNFAPPRC